VCVLFVYRGVSKSAVVDISFLCVSLVSRDSAVGIVTGYGLDD
jgi:hypothetical protein